MGFKWIFHVYDAFIILMLPQQASVAINHVAPYREIDTCSHQPSSVHV